MEKIQLKPEVDIFDLLQVDPTILEMIAFTYEYCVQYNLPCVITSLMEDVPNRKLAHIQTEEQQTSVLDCGVIFILRNSNMNLEKCLRVEVPLTQKVKIVL